MTSSEVENKTMPSSSQTKSVYAPKERGNNGVKRKEYFDIETVMEELYPTDKDFNPVLARLMKFRDSISYEYIPGKFIKRIRRQYFYSQNGTVYSGKLRPSHYSIPTMTVRSLREWRSYAICTQCRWSVSLNISRTTDLNCPSRLRITCSRKRQYFLTIFTILCAWLSCQINIWDVTRPTPKSSLKNPVRTVYMSKKVMSGWR